MKDNILFTSLFEDETYLAEELYNPQLSPAKQFLLYNKQQEGVDIVPSFDIEKEGQVFTIKPLPYSLIEHKVVLLPSNIDTKTTQTELDEKILSFLHKWVDIEPMAEQLALYYIKMTWVFDRMSVVPYLRALGSFGAGKTRAIQTIGALCYKPLFVSGASSDAYLFRIIELFKGTLVINELERLNTDLSGQITIILNNGYEQGLGVGRVEGDKTKTPTIYDVFSPKLLSTREPFQDLALESRIITLHLFPTTRQDIPFSLTHAFWTEAEQIRNALLFFRLQKVQTCGAAGLAGLDLDQEKEQALRCLEPRLRQTFSSLFAVVPSEKVADMLSFAAEYQQTVIEERGQALDGVVAKTLLSLLSTQKSVSVKTLREQVNLVLADENQSLTPQKISVLLKSLGVKTKSEGHDKVPMIVRNDLVFATIAKRYHLSYSPAVPQDPQQPLPISSLPMEAHE